MIWSEGTYEAGLAFSRVGIISLQTSLAIASLTATTLSGTNGPIQSDRNTEGRWGEFHTWSASAPGELAAGAQLRSGPAARAQ